MLKVTAHVLAAVLNGHRILSVMHSLEDIPMGAFDVYTLANGCLIVDCFGAPEPVVELYACVEDWENGVPTETFQPDER